MKKILTFCLIACAMSISSNSFCMLIRTSRINYMKKVFVQQKKFHPTILVYRSKQHKIVEQNNLLLQKLSDQLDIIQKQLDNSVVQHKERDSDDKNKVCKHDDPLDPFRAEIEAHHERHRRHGGFDSSNPYPYENYDDYMRYSSY